MDAEALKALYGDMSEATLEQNVRRAVLQLGGLYYHVHDSRRSDPGYPDCTIVIGHRLMFRELKTQKGRLSSEQVIWLEQLKAAGADAGIWRPYDWGNDTILRELS